MAEGVGILTLLLDNFSRENGCQSNCEVLQKSLLCLVFMLCL